jgi:hypothetical protein
VGSGRRGLRTAAIGAALSTAAPLGAQVTATTDLAFGAVRYQGFLGSAAASVTPGIRYDSRSLSAAAQGSYLVYESGNTLVQGAGAAAWLSPSVRSIRGELSGFGGLSRYAGEAVLGYGMARGRLHAMSDTRGVWVGAGIGQAYTSLVTAGTTELGIGAWTAFPGLAITVGATRSTAADSAYIDVASGVRWLRGPVEVNALVGLRAQSAANDEGLFGEVVARLALTRVIAAQVSAGEFPADPLRGAVAGRYLSAGLRLTFFDAGASVRTADERLRAELRLPVPLPPDAPELVLGEAAIGVRTLTIRGVRAERVELAGDFTDWRPVSLKRTRGPAWRLPVQLAPGVYRLNVRIDGGAWQVPRGATPQQDEFGGRVGLIVVR